MKEFAYVDIDETLFETHAKILVEKDGSVVASLTNSEFNNDVLGEGERFNFVEFSSTEKFIKTSCPIRHMIDAVRYMLDNQVVVYLLTARADFDDKDAFLNYLRKHGLDVGHKNDGKIHIVRVGNITGGMPSEKKKLVIHSDLVQYNPSLLHMFDDSPKNLDAFLTLQNAFSGTKFVANMVTPHYVEKYLT